MKKFVNVLLAVILVLTIYGSAFAQHDHSSMSAKDNTSTSTHTHKCKCMMSMDHNAHQSAQADMRFCKYCGMDREKFGHSKMLITYEDGSVTGTCSIHCTAIDLSVNIGKSVKSISVGDYNSKKLTDAEKAFWVIGGSKQGVMTKRAKWAFESKADAEAFIKANGGNHITFDEALKAAYADMYEDTKMIREKRKKMNMQSTMEHKH